MDATTTIHAKTPWFWVGWLQLLSWLMPLGSLLVIAGLFLRECLRVRWAVPVLQADVTVPIVHGFPASGVWLDHRKPNHGDDVFQHEDWAKDWTFCYLFSTWEIPVQIKQAWTDYAKQQSRTLIADQATMHYPLWPFMRHLLPLFLASCWAVIADWPFTTRSITASVTPMFLYQYCREFRTLCNIQTRVYLSKDDYAPAHVIRTEILHRTGGVNIGLMHSALVSEQYESVLADHHFDQYLIPSEAYTQLFPRWKQPA